MGTHTARLLYRYGGRSMGGTLLVASFLGEPRLGITAHSCAQGWGCAQNPQAGAASWPARDPTRVEQVRHRRGDLGVANHQWHGTWLDAARMGDVIRRIQRTVQRPGPAHIAVALRS